MRASSPTRLSAASVTATLWCASTMQSKSFSFFAEPRLQVELVSHANEQLVGGRELESI